MKAPERNKLASALALAEGETNTHDGERVAAINAVERLLKKNGLRLRDLAASNSSPARQMPEMGTWRENCQKCLLQKQLLRPWEANFLADVQAFRRLSAKQRWIIDEIATRIGVKENRRTGA